MGGILFFLKGFNEIVQCITLMLKVCKSVFLLVRVIYVTSLALKMVCWRPQLPKYFGHYIRNHCLISANGERIIILYDCTLFVMNMHNTEAASKNCGHCNLRVKNILLSAIEIRITKNVCKKHWVKFKCKFEMKFLFMVFTYTSSDVASLLI